MCSWYCNLGVLLILIALQCHGLSSRTTSRLEIRCGNDTAGASGESTTTVKRIILGDCSISIVNSILNDRINDIGNQRRCILSKLFPFKKCNPPGHRLIPPWKIPKLPWNKPHVPCPPHNKKPDEYSRPNKRPPPPAEPYHTLSEIDDTSEEEHESSEEESEQEDSESEHEDSTSDSETDDETKPSSQEDNSESASEEKRKPTIKPKREPTRKPKREPTRKPKKPKRKPSTSKSGIEINVHNNATNNNDITVNQPPGGGSGSGINMDIKNEVKNENNIVIGRK